jgi:hypothetical protein
MSFLLPQGTSVPTLHQQINAQESPPPVPGQKFIPHRQFRSGVFLPDVILANPACPAVPSSYGQGSRATPV